MKIAVDVMGGDYAPEAVIEGILLSLSSLSNDDTILAVGPQDTIEQLLAKHGYAGKQI
ncbi:MAG: Glycerol-3-phosphate 1-O-acyltransferase, partial [Bacteroidota bacterium]